MCPIRTLSGGGTGTPRDGAGLPRKTTPFKRRYAAACRFDRKGHEAPRVYLTQSDFKVVWQKLIRTQIRHLLSHISNSKGRVDGCVGE